MDQQAKEQLVRAIAATVFDHAEELTALDQAIGDGDHGLNLKRGFEAIVAALPGLVGKPLPDMFKTMGMTLVMKVGGASGPLFGTFFMELGKTLPAEPDRAAITQATGKAIEAVKVRGRSEPGQKLCSMSSCLCRRSWRPGERAKLSRPRHRPLPPAPFRSLPSGGAPPFSVSVQQDIWIRVHGPHP